MHDPILRITDIKVRPGGAKTRIYFWNVGQSIFDHMRNRGRERTDLYRRMFPAIIAKHREIEGKKISWSSRAGCSCGCSPGFIVDGCGGWDLHVDFRADSDAPVQ